MGETFTWRDGERTIRFGRGTIATADELLDDGYTLLTTPRAEGVAPDVVGGARTVHPVRARRRAGGADRPPRPRRPRGRDRRGAARHGPRRAARRPRRRARDRRHEGARR